MKARAWWADTLFKRLFLLMWAALVGSHLLAFTVVHSSGVVPQLPAGPDGADPGHGRPRLPTLGSLPPGGPFPAQPAQPALRPGPGPGQIPNGDPGRPARPPDRPEGPDERGHPGGHPGDLPSAALWLDYGIRFVVMGLAAALGARWLTAPVRRLGVASRALAQAIAQRTPLPALDERSGTREVRQAAQVFNTMAQQLQQQFDAQSLLMAAISHDLRTPLARLRLRLEALPAAQAERCIADVTQMDALIGNALEMVRARHVGSPPQRLDLPSLVQSVVDDLAEQGHAVTLRPLPAAEAAAPGSAAPWLVLARPAALARVLGNLLQNALRHGGQGALGRAGSNAMVEVGIEADAEALCIHIDDNGPGIPADRLEAVFQPFYRLAPAAVDAPGGGEVQAGGVGLGLYIARDLIEREGGRVTLSPRPAGGLRATVWLPGAG